LDRIIGKEVKDAFNVSDGRIRFIDTAEAYGSGFERLLESLFKNRPAH
jgi:aryl-alcohol dehydrogenase-like predicted oxidoreductase